MMTPFYATFGTGHGYHGCYVEIFAESEHAARAHMIREHAQRWSMLYPADQFAGQVERYGLHKLVTVRQRPCYPNEAPFFDSDRSAPSC